jgi:hypothetical protein
VLLGLSEPERFTELTLAAFGAPFPERLAGAWPTPRLSDGARLLAVLNASTWSADMVRRFDDDWFHNPRAGKEILNRITGPMRELPEPQGTRAAPPPSNADKLERLAHTLEAPFG